MRKITVALALVLVVALAAPAVQGDSFPDVDEDHWAYEAVEHLVAAGVVEGYPDGEYKGDQTMTRYEMAMIIQRALDNINEEFARMDQDIMYLEEDISALEDGLTAAQAEDVVAIVERMMEEEIGPQDELSEGQAEQVTEIVEAMVAEFDEELEQLEAELGALRYVIETQTDALWAETDDIQDTIDALDARVEDLEEPTFQFRGSYDVDFEHTQIVDGEVEDETTFNYWYVDEWPNQIEIEDEVENFDSAADYAQFVRDEIDAGTFDDVEDFNDSVPSAWEIQEDEDVDEYLPGWSGSDHFDAPEEEFGFSQTLSLGFDITTELFDASIDIDIDDDEFDLSETMVEVEADTWTGTYSPSNAVSQRDFAVFDETVDGATFDYHPWGIETFFGETVVDEEDVDDETAFTYDEDEEEWVFEEETEETDGYLLGAQFSREIAGLDVGASYAMEAHNYELTADDNLGVVGLDTSVDVANVDLNADFGYSYPFDEDEVEAGMLFRADALATLEGLADLSGNVRFRDEDFQPLYGDDDTFDIDEDDFDRFDDGIGEDALAFGVRADQDLIDLLTEGYAEFNMYNRERADADLTDWNVLVGGGAELLIDGLEGSASFERRFIDDEDEADEDTRDRVETGIDYEVGDLALNGGFEMLMVEDIDTDWLLFDAGASFDVTDTVSVFGDFEMGNNVLFTEDQDVMVIGAGAELEDMELLEDLSLSANAAYDMQTISGAVAEDIVDDGLVEEGDLDTNRLELGAGLTYERNALTLTNDFTFTNLSGDALMVDRTEEWYEGYYDDFGEELFDGNEIENVFGLEYEIIEDTDFTMSWTETFFNFDEDDFEDWQTREIEAGVSISF